MMTDLPKTIRPPRTWAWHRLYDGRHGPVLIKRYTRHAGVEGYEVERFTPGPEDQPFSRLPPNVRDDFVVEADLVDMKSAVTHLQCRLTETLLDEQAARERCAREVGAALEERARTCEQIHFVQMRRRDPAALVNSGNREKQRLDARAVAKRAPR